MGHNITSNAGHLWLGRAWMGCALPWAGDRHRRAAGRMLSVPLWSSGGSNPTTWGPGIGQIDVAAGTLCGWVLMCAFQQRLCAWSALHRDHERHQLHAHRGTVGNLLAWTTWTTNVRTCPFALHRLRFIAGGSCAGLAHTLDQVPAQAPSVEVGG
jgi:hypothetical protein